MQRRYLWVIGGALVACALGSFAAHAAVGDLDLTGFYQSGWTSGDVLRWFTITLAAIGAGVAIYLSAGALAPVAASLGTWIGGIAGLHGAAATSYGLALLGGGSLAAGGLGIKGGAAILTAALTLSTSISKDDSATAIEAAREWAEAAPIEYAGKPATSLLSLPMPSVETGTEGYRKAVRILREGYDRTASTVDPVNRDMVRAALSAASSAPVDSLDLPEKVTVLTGRALLALHNGEHVQARRDSGAAVQIALQRLEADPRSIETVALWEDITLHAPVRHGWLSPKKFLSRFRERDVVPVVSLPASIWAIASLADAKVAPDLALAALRAAIAADPKNVLIPLVVSAYMDRLDARAEEDFPTQVRAIYTSIDRVVPNSAERTRCLAIVAVRVLVRMQLNKLTVEAGLRVAPAGGKIRGKDAQRFFAHVAKDQDSLLQVGEVVLAAIKDRDGIDARDVEGIRQKLDEHRKASVAFEGSVRKASARLP